MQKGRLFIGNKRYSSWSLRGWLAVRLAGLEVEEVMVPLTGNGTAASPTGLVPYLEYDGDRVWESLAICEYCAELSPAIWPADREARNHARVIATEMHGGFRELRMAMPMNLGRPDFAGKGRTPAALADIARIETIWADTFARFAADGPFLFGEKFNGADAMYAPVVARFLINQPELSAETQAYCQAVRAHPLMVEWFDGAATEPAEWLRDVYENPA
jgi:glutathione S-transferase